MQKIFFETKYARSLFKIGIILAFAIFIIPIFLQRTVSTVGANDRFLNCSVSTYEVTSEVELNNAIKCFNQTVGGETTMNLGANINLSGKTESINNSNTSARLVVDGKLFTIDGSGNYRIFDVQAGKVTINRLVIENGADSSQDCFGQFSCGGAIRVNSGADVTIVDSNFRENLADFGGAVANYFGILKIERSFITDNSGKTGGGIFNSAQASLEITNSYVMNNSATQFGGGGIYNAGETTLEDSAIESNSSDGDGGGGIFNAGRLEILDSTLRYNSTTDGDGGGIHNFGNAILMAQRSSMHGNATFANGGAISNVSSTISLSNVTLSENSALKGGGIYVSGAGNTEIKFSTVTNNDARCDLFCTRLGGNIFHENSSLAELEITNSILSAGGNSGCYSTSGDLAVDSTNLADVEGCVGAKIKTIEEIGLAPLQNNGGLGWTHALLVGSVAIDAGTTDADVITDQRGISRPQGAAYDIGAFEVEQVTVPTPHPTRTPTPTIPPTPTVTPILTSTPWPEEPASNNSFVLLPFVTR